MRDHNTPDYWDPHHCIDSCTDPGYGCLSNPTKHDYLQHTKNKRSVCIHPAVAAASSPIPQMRRGIVGISFLIFLIQLSHH